jgi:hypothetical protein
MVFVWRDEGTQLKWWAGIDLEGSGHGHLKVFSWYLLRGTEENRTKQSNVPSNPVELQTECVVTVTSTASLERVRSHSTSAC